MRCPYCVSEIHDDAIVCPACHRDLYLFKPLLARIESLEKQVQAHEERLAQLSENGTANGDIPSDEFAESRDTATMPPLHTLLICVLTPLLMLVAAHSLITITYDLNTVFLRIVSLLIPLPFGLVLTLHRRRPSWLLIFAALGLSISAVIAMSSVTARVDGTPVFPVGLREWREFIEYAASISFSYATGCILGGISRRKTRKTRRANSELALAIAKLITTSVSKTDQIQTTAKKIHELGSSLSAAATTAAAMYTGLQGFLGK